MMNKTVNNIDSGYMRNIQKVCDLKERAYQETKDLNYFEYVDYIQNNIKDIKHILTQLAEK